MKIDEIKDLLQDRILILDGAMGTMIQEHNLSEEEYRGDRFADFDKAELQGNNDLLSLTQPDIIKDIHRQFLAAGSDIIETNTFNSTSISQADYQMQDLAYELNVAAAKNAREVADEFTEQNPDKPRFVAGAIGPTNKTLSLSPDVEDPGYRAITFDQLKEAYSEQIRGLVDGGADILLVETIFDTLNAKAAIYAIHKYQEETGHDIPVMISGTIVDQSGRTLSGQTTEAFWISISHTKNLLSVGLNCSLGSKQMRPYIEELANIADCHTSLYPNAGLPDEMGEYNETPEFMADQLREYAESNFVNLVGGCCGTTPEHIEAIAEAAKECSPRQIPEQEPYLRLSGLEPLVVRPDTNFVNIGERTNVMGSRKFKRLIKNEEYEEALSVARQQVENGAQIIDINMGCPAKKVCKAWAGSALMRDEAKVEAILHAVVRAVDVPVTLKIRTGWASDKRNAPVIARIAEDAGIAALAVHGRTRDMKYQGVAEYDTIARIKQDISIPVWANGDVGTPEKARQVLDHTGVDGLLIGRAAQGRPWIFSEIRHFLETGERLAEKSPAEIGDILVGHLEALHEFYGEYRGVRIARKHLGWYVKAHPGSESFRREVLQVEDAAGQIAHVRGYFTSLHMLGRNRPATGRNRGVPEQAPAW